MYSKTLECNGKLCLLALAVSSCFSGNSFASENTTLVPNVDISSSFETPSVFEELNTDDYEIFLNQLNGGTPVYTNDPGWNLSTIFKDPDIEINNSANINFAFFQNEAGSHAYKLWDYGDKADQFVVNQSLNIWMVSYFDGFFVGEEDGSTNSALELNPNNNVPSTTVNFNNQVDLNYIAYGDGSRAISIGTNVGSSPNEVVNFNDNLNVKGLFYGKQNTVLFLGSGTKTVFNGETILIGVGDSAVSGIYFMLTIENDPPEVVVNNNLIISADYVLEGTGVVTVDYQNSDPIHWAALYGSLDRFTGTWDQTGGYLYVDGKMNASQNWIFSDVWLATNSENVLEYSFDKWDTSSPLIQKALFKSDQLKGLVLTDPVLSLDYLTAAATAYSGTTLLFDGELYVNDNIITEVGLDGLKQLYGINSNFVLTHVTLNLEDQAELVGESIHVGAVKSNNGSNLTLTNTDLTLYRTSSSLSVAENVPHIDVGENSVLTLYGGHAKERENQVRLDSVVDIDSLGTMNLYGIVDLYGDISNKGILNFQAGSDVNFLATLYQEEGTTEIKNGADVAVKGGIQLDGGELAVQGTLQAPSFKQTSGTSDFNGKATITDFEINGSGRNSAPLATVGTGGNLITGNLILNSGHLLVGDGNRNVGRAFLTTDSLSITGNGSLTVTGNGVLIYGNNDTFNDKNAHLTYYNILDMASLYGVDQNAILGVNKKIDLANVAGVVIGGSGLSAVALDSSSNTATTALTLGEGSTLIVSSTMKDPVFSSSSGTNTVSLEDGSTLLVLDSLKPVNLTDNSVEILDDHVGSTIVSTSSYVDLAAMKTEDGWVFVKSLDMEKATSSFIYPTIQTFLYMDYDDFNTTSKNVGAQFLAKADNKLYIPESIKNKIIAQTTQVSRMLGTKLTAYESAWKSIEYLSRDLKSSSSMKAGDHAIFGGINYDFFLSRHMNSYLGGTGFRSNSQNVDFGLIYALDDSTRVGVGFGATTVDSKPRRSSVNASNRQWNFMVNVGLEKDLPPFKFGAEAGYLFSKNRIKGTVPSSMEMDRLTSDSPNHMFSVGVDAGWLPFQNVTIGLKPMWRYFVPETESIKFGGVTGFKSKSHSQSFVDVPLYVGFKGNVGRVGNAEIDLSANIDGALRFGQRKDKVDLSIPGVSATEKLKLDSFGKWNTGVEFAATARTKKTKTSLSVGARTGGDSTVGVAAMLTTRWTF